MEAGRCKLRVLGCLGYDFILTVDKPNELDDSNRKSGSWVRALDLAHMLS